MERIVTDLSRDPDLSLSLFVWQVQCGPPRVTGVGLEPGWLWTGHGQEPGECSEETVYGFEPGAGGLGEDGIKDWGVAHTRGGSPRKKQPWGSHSHKKWAAPVDAWSVSTNIPWKAPRKNTAKSLIVESTLPRLHMLGAKTVFK